MYELMLVTNVERGDQLLIRVEKSIKAADVSDYKVDRLGKKVLAYQIRKQTDSNYYVLSFNAPGDWISSLTEKLRLEQEDLLRFMLLKKVGKKKSKKSKGPDVVKAETAQSGIENKPKVTVAVKKVSTVKSKTEKKASSPFTKATGDKQVSKVRKVSKEKKDTKSTTNKKDKSKKK